MFPSELATGICSLNPRVDRLVQSCLMEIDGNGSVVRNEFHDGVINTAARMTYTDVNAILTEKPAALMSKYRELVPKFEQMADLFRVLNARRKRRGSIDFDLPQAEVVLDDAGRVASIVESERNIAHKLIEEFMLLANETVATYVEGRGMPSLYRIHEQPDPLKVEQFEEFVSGFGYSLAAPAGAVRPRNFQKLLEKLHGKPEERPIAFLMLRTMQKARYARAQPRTLRACRRFVHALHIADSAVSGSRRASNAARSAPREVGRRPLLKSSICRKWPPHVRHGAARRRSRARAGAVEESPLHGRQGRRRVRRLHHRRGGIRLVRPAGALRRGARARVEHGRRLLPLPRENALAERREHLERVTASAPACACRSSASTWSGGRSISGSSRILLTR